MTKIQQKTQHRLNGDETAADAKYNTIQIRHLSDFAIFLAISFNSAIVAASVVSNHKPNRLSPIEHEMIPGVPRRKRDIPS